MRPSPPATPGIQTWTTSNGELKFWRPAPHVIVTRFQGTMFDAHLANLAMLAIEDVIAREQPRVDIFHDWEEMELYATQARTLMTERAVPLAGNINSLNVMLGSKVVLMGVSLSSIKLGGIPTFTQRKEFEQAIQRAVQSAPGTFVLDPLPTHSF